MVSVDNASADLLQNLNQSIKIVLVETSHPGNIGGVARAIKNMGLSRLCLVSPQTFPSEEAVARSSGAEDLLDEAEVVSSLDEALKDCSLVFGASARTRKIAWPLLNPRDSANAILDHVLKGDHSACSVALVFGREASGLTNEELQRCHYHVSIPANPDYASLNLAMAVQVICYEIRMAALLSLDKQDGRPHDQLTSILSASSNEWDGELATAGEFEGFIEHLERALEKIGYHDPSNPRQLMVRLRRLFQRAHMDKMEVNIMRGMLKDVLKLTEKG